MADESLKFYSVEKLGPKRRLTPEGYLVVEDTPIARTGVQLYRAGEVPVPPGPDGVVRIERTDEHVFRPETIASANGKDIVDDHPNQSEPEEDGWDVNPSNYGMVSKGVVLNPRRGTGADSDLLIGDVMIKDLGAIRAVLGGKVELSCGYNADYETIEQGRGRQHNIIINHVALVDSGRCGPRCAIGDEDTMTTRTRDKTATTTLDKAFAALDKIRRGWGARDEKLVQEGMKEVNDEMTGMTTEGPTPAGNVGGPQPGGDSHVHIHLNGKEGNGAASGPGTVAEADVAENPAAPDPAAGSENAVETDIAKRVTALEAGVAKIIEILGGDEEAEEPVADAGATNLEDDPEPAATGDDTSLMDDPVPAATGDSNTVVSTVVRGGKKVRVRVRDSAHLQTGFDDVLARAEILVPGMKLPTYDAKAPATATVKTMCDFRRQTLARALASDTGHAHVSAIGGARTKDALPTMTCDSVKVLFNGASELARVANNGGSRVENKSRDNDGGIRTLRDVNAKNRELWGQPKR